MNLLNKLQNEYDQLWKLIIRPNRTPYPESALGPQTFILEGKQVKRIDFQLINPRGKVFFGSHFVPLQEQSYPCLIYMHGNSSNRTEGMEYLGELISKNISLCTFDFSGCGNAEGEYVTLGYYEWEDLHEVVEWIRHKEKVTNIGIWGRSMGAVTGLLYLKKSEHIQAGVFDSPFKSLKCLIEDLVKKNSKIPMWVLAGALKIISNTIQQKAHFDIYKLNPLKYEVPFVKHPAFFIVGTQDQLIPSTHTQQLFAAYKGKTKQIRLVPGGHNDQRPDQCINDAIQFLCMHLKKKRPIKIISQKPFKQQITDLLQANQDLITTIKTQKNANQIDFFAQNDNGGLSHPRTEYKLFKQFDQKEVQQEDYRKFQQMKEMPVENIDFFSVKQVNFSDQKHGQSQKRIKEAKNVASNLSSLTSIFSSVMGKANVFSFGGKVQSPTVKVTQKKVVDDYDGIRRKISTCFSKQESDFQEKLKMERVQALGRIIKDQSNYTNFDTENQGKVETWIFV